MVLPTNASRRDAAETQGAQTHPMSTSVRQLMDEQAAGLVGRSDEMAVLRQLLGEAGPVVVFIHGIAGVGKSALAESFSVQPREAGATVLRLDGRSVEPTPRGFLAALEGKTGGDLATADAAAARLGRLGERVILVVDTHELLRMLDPWLRQTLVPALSDNVRIVLSGREPPMTGWRTTLGGLFRGLTIENLSRDDAEALLGREGSTATPPGVSIGCPAATPCRFGSRLRRWPNGRTSP